MAEPSRRARIATTAAVAAADGRNVSSPEDVRSALFDGQPSVLEAHWPRVGRELLRRGQINDFDRAAPQEALAYPELVELVRSIVPGPVHEKFNSAQPVSITYSVKGPDAEEFRAVIDGVG
ncbi:hypothetical protein DFR70_119168 [Nocardia tenerifensis]|uniref:Uncharacterized protein n=1 Tax=Nocardia tenerifensis TaxID=228006 RepID=A0A318JR16_9NOCA|nr:hypothetical protein DFR70_119168 [Nocardia tenerifensis]